jgi:hypothetical protein
MKNFYLSILCFLLTKTFLQAQDTLLFQDFELTSFYSTTLISDVPPGNSTDANWYSWDSDDLADGSGSTVPRPKGWYRIRPFSEVDQYQTIHGTISNPDTNTAIAANSWTGGTVPQNNWLITSNVHLGKHDTLFWKSAPLQTPRYCDGYEVRLATTDNADNTGTGHFSNLLFTAAEMVGTPATDPDTVYAHFTFAPAAAFVHGFDGTHVDNAGTTSPISHRGQLQQFFVPLSAYADQNIFIAFVHNSTDDNEISFDDVMIRGDVYVAGINENKASLDLNLFPNPASDMVQVNYNLTTETKITINVVDVTGKLIMTETKGEQTQGRHFSHINTADLAKGFYTVCVQTDFGTSNVKLIVQ